jgi:hypothetical protein
MSLVGAYVLLSSVTSMYSCLKRLSKCFNSSLEQYNFLHKRIKPYVISVHPYAAHITKYNSLCMLHRHAQYDAADIRLVNTLDFRRIIPITSFREETPVG